MAPVDPSDLEVFVETASASQERIGVVLTDTTMLSGLVEPYRPPDPNVTLRVSGAQADFLVSVPLERVSGAYPMAIDQSEIHTVGDAAPVPVSQSLDVQTVDRARKVGIEISETRAPFREKHLLPPRWGRWKIPQGYLLLYCDWKYFENTSGGLDELGVAYVVSLTAGGRRSLQSFVYEALKRPSRGRWEICQYSDGVVEGSVAPLGDVTIGAQDSLHLEMDDGTWTAKAVRAASSGGARNDASAWTLAYFGESSKFVVPYEQWQYADGPVRIYGDVVPGIPAMTDCGAATCYVKARAAARLGRSRGPGQ